MRLHFIVLNLDCEAPGYFNGVFIRFPILALTLYRIDSRYIHHRLKKNVQRGCRKYFTQLSGRVMIRVAVHFLSITRAGFFFKTGHSEKNKKIPRPIPHPIHQLLPLHTRKITKNPLFRQTVHRGHEEVGAETPKTPQNAPFVKRGISEKLRKTPGFHRDWYIGGKHKRSSF